jgi:hypothetical protein
MIVDGFIILARGEGMIGGSPCPKCGSDQILNDQCVKCGIVISKYRAPGAEPVSFVAAPRQTELPAPGYSIPASVIEQQKVRAKSKRITQAIAVGMILAVVGFGTLTYRFLTHRASQYSGLYKNGRMLFLLKLPQKDSKWYHFREDESDSPLFKDAMDGFYRGDADDPEIGLGIWLQKIPAQPDRFPPGTVNQLQTQAEDDLLQMMVNHGIDCTLTTTELLRVGDNDGFRMDADITIEDKPMKLIALRGYHVDHGYWFLLSATEATMNENEEEIERILGSISYDMSLI